MNFKYPQDVAKSEFLIFDLFHTTGLLQQLPDLMGFKFDDEDWGKIIEAIEQIQFRKQREYTKMIRSSIVGRPISVYK